MHIQPNIKNINDAIKHTINNKHLQRAKIFQKF